MLGLREKRTLDCHRVNRTTLRFRFCQHGAVKRRPSRTSRPTTPLFVYDVRIKIYRTGLRLVFYLGPVTALRDSRVTHGYRTASDRM